MRALVAEDDGEIAVGVADALEREGLRTEIVQDGPAAVKAARREAPALVVLDVMMPGLDGFGVCAELRRLKIPAPILMLTAKDTIEDRVRGLEEGADDYLVKPFDERELVARVRALLRRDKTVRTGVIAVGDLEVDTRARTVHRGGRRDRADEARVHPPRGARPERGAHAHPRGDPRAGVGPRGGLGGRRELPRRLAPQEARRALPDEAHPHRARLRLCSQGRMKSLSIRRRVVLGNAALVAALLGIFGLGIVLGTGAVARAGRDAELRRDAERGPRGPRRGGPPGDGGPPRGLNGNPSGEPGGRPGGDLNGGSDGRPGAGPGGPPPESPYEEALRRADLRRPRFMRFERREDDFAPEDTPLDPAPVARARAGEETLTTVARDGEPVRVLTHPIREGGRVVGAVQIGRGLGDLDDLLRSQLLVLAGLLPLGALAAAGGASLLVARTLRPVEALTTLAATLGEGDLSRRIAVESASDDELTTLARTFNAMLGRIEGSFARVEAALASERRFTADASHELRTPLTRMRLATSAAMISDASPETLRSAVTSAHRASLAMTRLVEGLLTLARADAGAPRARPPDRRPARRGPRPGRGDERRDPELRRGARARPRGPRRLRAGAREPRGERRASLGRGRAADGGDLR